MISFLSLFLSIIFLSPEPAFSGSANQLFNRAAGHAHRAALSQALAVDRIAKDVRIAVGALLSAQSRSKPKLLVKRSQQPQCRLNAFPAGQSSPSSPTFTSTPTSTSTGSRSSPTSKSSSPAPTSNPTSNFQLVHSYVWLSIVAKVSGSDSTVVRRRLLQ